MATAIFLGSLIVGAAINPEYVFPKGETTDTVGWILLGFIVYDLLRLNKD